MTPTRTPSGIATPTPTATPESAACVATPLGVAGWQDIYTSNSVSLGESDISGSLAICANLDLQNVAVGTSVTELRDVIVAASVTGNGAVVYGNAVYSQTCEMDNVTYQNGGASFQGWPIDFGAADAVLASLCGNITALQANGDVVVDETGLQLTGTDPDANVFDVSAENLGLGIAVSFSMPKGATAIVRVAGSGVTMSGLKVYLGDASPKKVMWSLCDTQNLIVEGAVSGTILAPPAYVEAGNAAIEGTLAATSVNGTITTKTALFSGCIPVAY